MEQPPLDSDIRQGSDVCGTDDCDRKDEKRAAVAQMKDENSEGLGMKVLAVLVQRYGVLPKEMWDLNSISDMGAGRGITYSDGLSKAEFKRIISNNRYSIVNLTIGRDVTHKVDLPGTLRRLEILARPYNFPFDLPSTLQEVTFDDYCVYNHPLVLPSKLRKLVLGSHYSQPLLLPPRLQRLAFATYGSRFNLPVTLPEDILSVEFGGDYNQATILPSGIQELRVGEGFLHDLSLPSSLRKLGWWCNRPIQVPEGISEMLFGCCFDQAVILPSSLRRVTFLGRTYSHPVTFPNGLTEVWWNPSNYDGLVLPERLQKLAWGSGGTVKIPVGLKELVIHSGAPLVLPEGLLKVTFSCWSERHYDLPQSVQEVILLGHANFTHPKILQHLILDRTRTYIDLSSHRVHKLTIGDSRITITAWPQGLKELAFTVDMDYPLQVPNGCRIVGEKRPANVVME